MAGPVAPALKVLEQLGKLLNKWLDGTKGRRTRKALLSHNRFVRRLKRVHPEILNDSGEFKDKHLRKHHEVFKTNSIRK